MADSIKIGNLDISAFKVGSSDCKIYLGDTLLYPSSQPPTPTFQGKWLATYTGGTTSSAECDASSAITQNEITLTNLVSVEIGDCVTTIGDNAFQNCSSLTTVTIGSGITSIGTEAFYTCYNLTSITILATTPPTLGMFSLNMSDDCPIYVPAASVNAYQSASAEWAMVSYRIQAIPNS